MIRLIDWIAFLFMVGCVTRMVYDLYLGVLSEFRRVWQCRTL